MKISELIPKLLDVANNHKTLYVMGCFGAPLTGGNVARYQTNHSYNKSADRVAMIAAAGNKNPVVYGFDCVNLIKGIAWGWCGDASKTYGGASYATNGVPDTNADGMIGRCKNVSTDFSKIKVGSAVWLPGHIGVYIGNGLVVESTPAFRNCVQLTVCTNISNSKDYSGRKWTKHGEMPYFEYDMSTAAQTPTAPAAQATTAATEIAVGDKVAYSGGTHYVHSNASAAEGKPCQPGTAEVTATAPGALHPYHVVGDKAPCTAYGWVDAATLAKI